MPTAERVYQNDRLSYSEIAFFCASISTPMPTLLSKTKGNRKHGARVGGGGGGGGGGGSWRGEGRKMIGGVPEALPPGRMGGLRLWVLSNYHVHLQEKDGRVLDK